MIPRSSCAGQAGFWHLNAPLAGSDTQSAQHGTARLRAVLFQHTARRVNFGFQRFLARPNIHDRSVPHLALPPAVFHSFFAYSENQQQRSASEQPDAQPSEHIVTKRRNRCACHGIKRQKARSPEHNDHPLIFKQRRILNAFKVSVTGDHSEYRKKRTKHRYAPRAGYIRIPISVQNQPHRQRCRKAHAQDAVSQAVSRGQIQDRSQKTGCRNDNNRNDRHVSFPTFAHAALICDSNQGNTFCAIFTISGVVGIGIAVRDEVSVCAS